MPVVGDGLTLTFKTPWETNTVACKVMWMAGTLCGVKYTGKLETKVDQPKKRAQQKPAADSGTSKKSGKAKRSSTRRRSALPI